MSNNAKKTDFGFEVTWAATSNYCGKILVFERPCKTSLNFNKEKQKTWFVNSGNFRVRWVDTKDGKLYEKDIAEGSVFHVEPLMPVSLEALSSGASLTEIGTPDVKDDTFCVIPATNIGD